MWRDTIRSMSLTRYYSSVFFWNAFADKLRKKVLKKDLDFENVIQVSMDELKVNWRLFDLAKQGNSRILETSSCDLHINHGTFKSSHDLNHDEKLMQANLRRKSNPSYLSEIDQNELISIMADMHRKHTSKVARCREELEWSTTR